MTVGTCDRSRRSALRLPDDVIAAASRRPLLSPERERALFEVLDADRGSAAGDAARVELIESNLRLAIAEARRYVGYGLSFEDLVAEGWCGLCEAVDRFDVRRGTRLSTYASVWVRRWLRKAVSRSTTVHVPRRVYWATIEGSRIQGVSESDAALGRVARRPKSIPSGGRGLAAAAGADPADVAEEDDLKASIPALLAGLPPRLRDVVVRRFGLDGRIETLDEIGRDLGVTKERVRQLERDALDALRKGFAA